LCMKKPIEVFNAHIIFETEGATHIYSHLGLKNAGAFKFSPDVIVFPPAVLTRMVKINLGEENKQYSYQFVGVAVNSLAFYPDVLYQASLQEGQGLVIIREDLGTSEKKRCYLAPEMIKDSMYVDPSQFTYFPKSINITAKKASLDYPLQAFATSPNKKEFVHLENNFSDIDSIAVPEGIPSNWNYYFMAQTPTGFVEKETQGNIKAVNLNAQISLKNKAYKEGVLNLQCSEGVDWVRTVTYFEFPPAYNSAFVWTIEGHPDLFERFEVPDLTPYISDAANVKAKLFEKYNVTLIYSGEFDYEDILRGFPWKTGEPFRNGKEGLEIVKEY
jgi:hypothetical protein